MCRLMLVVSFAVLCLAGCGGGDKKLSQADVVSAFRQHGFGQPFSTGDMPPADDENYRIETVDYGVHGTTVVFPGPGDVEILIYPSVGDAKKDKPFAFTGKPPLIIRVHNVVVYLSGRQRRKVAAALQALR